MGRCDVRRLARPEGRTRARRRVPAAEQARARRLHLPGPTHLALQVCRAARRSRVSGSVLSPRHVDALEPARSSLPRLCASLALAPLRLLTDPAVAAVQACAAWRGYMAQTAAPAQVRPHGAVLPQEHGVSVGSACGLFMWARRAHSTCIRTGDRLWHAAHAPAVSSPRTAPVVGSSCRIMPHSQDEPPRGAHPAARWVRRAAAGGAHVAAAAWARSRSRAPSATLFMWLLRAVAAQEVAVALAVRPRPARMPG